MKFILMLFIMLLILSCSSKVTIQKDTFKIVAIERCSDDYNVTVTYTFTRKSGTFRNCFTFKTDILYSVGDVLTICKL